MASEIKNSPQISQIIPTQPKEATVGCAMLFKTRKWVDGIQKRLKLVGLNKNMPPLCRNNSGGMVKGCITVSNLSDQPMGIIYRLVEKIFDRSDMLQKSGFFFIDFQCSAVDVIGV
jgi:hypothetical protein